MGVAELKCIWPPGRREVASTGIFSSTVGCVPSSRRLLSRVLSAMVKHGPTLGLAENNFYCSLFPSPLSWAGVRLAQGGGGSLAVSSGSLLSSLRGKKGWRSRDVCACGVAVVAASCSCSSLWAH